ncbi:MAG TPA: lytic murein transglycosylase, partial [Solirubrobacterales bacterium]|nr:lytic murein transglycosylase [Solirubrobacterales bacterium]
QGNSGKNDGNQSKNDSSGNSTGNQGKNNGNQTANPKNDITGAAADIIPGADSPLSAKITVDPSFGLSGDSTPVAACDGSAGPPRNLIPIYVEASKKYGLGERGPQILAAINSIETDFGRLNEVTSSAGAIGWMQFMPSTWDMYATDGDGDGKTDPYNPHDAIHAAARYLQAAGAPTDWYDAIYAYNHADWYVQDVLDKAACYGSLGDTVQTEEQLKNYICQASDARVLEIPNYYMRGFEDAASRYGLGKRGIWVLAAVARLESDYGRGMTPQQLKDTGPMGLSREEWKKYGVDGDGDGYVERDEPWDGIATFARLLWSQPTLEEGLFEHNHATWYVEAAVQDAGRIAGDCQAVKTDWNIAYPVPT